MTDRLRESVSALMDDQADELEVRRVMKAMDDDEELVRQWDRYHLIQAAMKSELIESSSCVASRISAAIAEEPALDVEFPFEDNNTEVVAQEENVSAAVSSSIATQPAAAVASMEKSIPWWQSAGRTAIAASVAVAVVLGVQTFSGQSPTLPNTSGTNTLDLVGNSNNAVAPSLSQPSVSSELGLGSTFSTARFNNGSVEIQPASQTPQESKTIIVTQKAYSSNDDASRERLQNYLLQHSEGAAAHTGRVRMPFARVANFDRSVDVK